MKPVRIFQHIAFEGPGYFAHYLERHNIPFEIIAVDAGDNIPETTSDISALVFMGGFMSVNDDLPWIAGELDLIRRAQQQNIPMLGHCLGGQLIAKALGGSVGANKTKEIGWHPTQQADNPVARDWLAGLPEQFSSFHWHGETFSIPEGATNILSSEHCTNQAFVVGNTLALQCHIEMLPEMVKQWADEYAHEIAQPSASIQNKATMTEGLDAKITQLHGIADKLYGRWLRPLLQQ